jgi:tetratricopeptide (TPR) repeat protein
MPRTLPYAILPLALTLALSATAIAGPLYGDEPDVSSTTATADDWLRLGLARYTDGDFKGAIDAFLTGNQLDPRPAFLFAIGQAERRRGDCAAAIVYYERFLASSPPESQAAAARDQRDRCEHAVGAAAVSEPTLPAPTVVLTREPAEPAPTPRHAARPWWKDPLPVGLGAGAAVLTVTGAALLASAAGLADDAAAATTYDAHAALRADAISRHTYGVISLGAGLALGAATAVVIWKPWHRDDVVITPGPGAGVAMAGSW